MFQKIRVITFFKPYKLLKFWSFLGEKNHLFVDFIIFFYKTFLVQKKQKSFAVSAKKKHKQKENLTSMLWCSSIL